MVLAYLLRTSLFFGMIEYMFVELCMTVLVSTALTNVSPDVPRTVSLLATMIAHHRHVRSLFVVMKIFLLHAVSAKICRPSIRACDIPTAFPI